MAAGFLVYLSLLNPGVAEASVSFVRNFLILPRIFAAACMKGCFSCCGAARFLRSLSGKNAASACSENLALLGWALKSH
jgi:hypothetical protein